MSALDPELRTYPDALAEWLTTPIGKTAQPWQVEMLSGMRFPVRPRAKSFDQFLDALNTSSAVQP